VTRKKNLPKNIIKIAVLNVVAIFQLKSVAVQKIQRRKKQRRNSEKAKAELEAKAEAKAKEAY